MFRKNVYTFKNFPVEERERKWTDCCCTIIGALFALTLFVLSFIFFTRNNFYEVNFPVDSTQKTCAYDQKDASFLFFENINRLEADKHCVRSCPKAGQSLACSKEHLCPGIKSTYDTKIQVNRLGGFCLPTNPELRQKFWQNNQIQKKNSLVNGYDIIMISFVVALCVGLLYMILVACFPKLMTFAAFILAFIVLAVVGILMLTKPIQIFTGFWHIFFAVVLMLFAILFLIFFCCYQKELEVAAIFMHHGNNFLKQNPLVYLWIPVFLILNFGLVVLCVWQYVAFGTKNKPFHTQNNLYETSGTNYFWQILLAIQFIWGIQFLRDSFNYIVSGAAVEWYFTANGNGKTQCCRPLKRLLCKNFGSVVGGSFLNAFFSIPTLLLDIFRCDPKGCCGKCFSCYKCCCCEFLLELVRTDAYAYIHLSGIPFCNAARQCQALCLNSRLFASTQSCIRLYRIAAVVFIVTLSVIISYCILWGRIEGVNKIILVLIILFAFMGSNYFVDIHANAAESLLICYLSEENCEGMNLDVCPAELRNDIFNFEEKNDLLPV